MGNQFVVPAGKKSYTSTDGVTWVENSGFSSAGFGNSPAYDISWNGSQLVVCGNGGGIATS